MNTPLLLVVQKNLINPAARMARVSQRGLAGTSSTTDRFLHHEWIEAQNPTQEETTTPIVFLHGLLGNSRNIKTMANKLCQATNRRGILLDITGHGKSKSGSSSVNVDFAQAVHNIHSTIASLVGDDDRPIHFVGHSLGGRLALKYASHQQVLRPRPDKLWLLDTVPGTPDASVMQTLQAARQILTTTWESRQDITTALEREYKLSKPIAMWLGSQFDVQEQQFAFDVNAAESLARDFPHQDFWEQLNHVSSTTHVHIVQAEKNPAWAPWQSLMKERSSSSHVHFHVLPRAGHWVHVDNLPGLMEIFLSEKHW